MSARDELEKCFKAYGIGHVDSRVLADALAQAGYRKPRTVASLEELKSLEDPATILKDYCGHPYQWGIGPDGSEGWMAPHDQTPITTNHLWRFVPLTVLHE
jgi:hypothetical protein